MGARKARMTRKANALFVHNPNYTFRQLMDSYRFWKARIKTLPDGRTVYKTSFGSITMNDKIKLGIE